MSSRTSKRRNISTKEMSKLGAVATTLQTPPMYIISKELTYNVEQGTAPNWIAFNTVNRMQSL